MASSSSSLHKQAGPAPVSDSSGLCCPTRRVFTSLSFQQTSDESQWAPSLPGRATRACLVTFLVSSPTSQLHSHTNPSTEASDRSGTLGDHQLCGARVLTILELWDSSDPHPAASKSLGSEVGRAPSHPKPQRNPELFRVDSTSTEYLRTRDWPGAVGGSLACLRQGRNSLWSLLME